MSQKRTRTWRYKLGRHERIRRTPGAKLGHPVWDADLDSIDALKRLKRAAELHWGTVLRVLEPGWDPLEEVGLQG